MKTRQKTITENGVERNICPICNKAVHYPEGVYFRNGKEVHCHCVNIARARRGKIEGIDYTI